MNFVLPLVTCAGILLPPQLDLDATVLIITQAFDAHRGVTGIVELHMFMLIIALLPRTFDMP